MKTHQWFPLIPAATARTAQRTHEPRSIAKPIADKSAHVEGLQQLFDVKTGDPRHATEALKRYEDDGYFLMERMAKLGAEDVVRVKDDYTSTPADRRQADIVEFLAKYLQPGAEGRR